MDSKLMQNGAFSWFELCTNDANAAKSFYSGLFGWDLRDMPMQSMTYTVVRVGDEDVAGIMPIPAESQGMRPAWGMYITVDNVDAAAEKVRELGGTILIEPRDIPEVGRFCVVQDPQGAWFSMMTYKK